MPNNPVIVHELPSEEIHERMPYSDWPNWLRRWRVNVYAVGILLTMLSVVTDFADTPLLGVGAVGEFLTLRLFVAFMFGLYVGVKEIHQPVGWRLPIVGLLAGILTGWSSYVGWVYLFDTVPQPLEGSVGPLEQSTSLLRAISVAWSDVLITYVFGTFLVFISGVLVGRGVQQKAEQDRWGAQNVADASVQQGQATGTGTTRTSTILGLVLALATPLVQSIAAAVFAAIFGGNGGN